MIESYKMIIQSAICGCYSWSSSVSWCVGWSFCVALCNCLSWGHCRGCGITWSVGRCYCMARSIRWSIAYKIIIQNQNPIKIISNYLWVNFNSWWYIWISFNFFYYYTKIFRLLTFCISKSLNCNICFVLIFLKIYNTFSAYKVLTFWCS